MLKTLQYSFEPVSFAQILRFTTSAEALSHILIPVGKSLVADLVLRDTFAP